MLCLFSCSDPNASLPEGVDPVNIAALIKCYIASLPEPLTTFELYSDIRNARSSMHVMRNTLKRLPTVNYMTLELVTALLLCVSQKSFLNKVDCISISLAHSRRSHFHHLAVCGCVSFFYFIIVIFFFYGLGPNY